MAKAGGQSRGETAGGADEETDGVVLAVVDELAEPVTDTDAELDAVAEADAVDDGDDDGAVHVSGTARSVSAALSRTSASVADVPPLLLTSASVATPAKCGASWTPTAG